MRCQPVLGRKLSHEAAISCSFAASDNVFAYGDAEFGPRQAGSIYRHAP
jgi:hypothetical protein